MPDTYSQADPATGKVVTVRGDHQPSAEEWQTIFSHVGGQTQTNDLHQSSLEDSVKGLIGSPNKNQPPTSQPSMLSRIGDVAMNPEVAGLAGSFFGPEAAIPAAGGMSIVRDLVHGERSPLTIGAHAAEHAGINAIPGALTKFGPKAIDLLTGVATGGKAGLFRSAIEHLMGKGAAEAAPSAAETISGIQHGGASITSPEGYQSLRDTLQELSGSGKAFGDPQFDAINNLIRQARGAEPLIDPASTSLPLRPEDIGLNITTPAMRGAAAAAKKATTIGRIQRAIHSLIGGGSVMEGY